MPLIQIIIVAFAAYALTRAVARFRDGSLGIGRLALWLVVWIAIALVALLPQTASRFAALVGVGRGADAVIYVAILVLYYLVFRIFLRLEKLDHDITVVVRKIGLKDAEKRQ